ncbi:MAG: carbonic anhydrase [Bacillota bacterium]
MKNNILNLLLAASVIFFSISFRIQAQEGETKETGDASLQRLIEGNNRYLSGNLKQKDFPKERGEQVSGQKPYAIVLTCADSRVPPEIIFDEDLGDIFVIRVAGNVIDDVTLGSVEYAAEHLNAPLLLIMGHTSCGAVKATLDGGHFSKGISSITKRIQHAVKQAKNQSEDKKEQLTMAIKNNVVDQMIECVKSSSIIKELEHEGKLKIAGGIYDIHTGQVTLF